MPLTAFFKQALREQQQIAEIAHVKKSLTEKKLEIRLPTVNFDLEESRIRLSDPR